MSLADDPRAYLRQARDLIKQGEPNAAAELLAVARALAPDDLDVASALADSHHRAGRSSEAASIWAEIVASRSPETIRKLRIHLKLSRAAFADGRKVAGIAHLTDHVRADPADRRSALQLLKHRLDAVPTSERQAALLSHFGELGPTEEADLLQAIYVDAIDSPLRAADIVLADPSRFAQMPDLALDAVRVAKAVGPDRSKAFLDALVELFPGDGRFTQAAVAESSAPTFHISGPSGGEAGSGPPSVDLLSAIRQHCQRRDWAPAVDVLNRMLGSEAFDVEVARLGLRAALALDDRDTVDRCLAHAADALSHRQVDGIRAIAALESMSGRHDAAAARLAPLFEQPVTREVVRGDFARAAMEAGRYRQAWVPLAEGLEATLPEDRRLRDLAIQCHAALASTPATAERFPDALIDVALARPPRHDGPFEPGLVVLVTSTLAAGGAERQVALTARSLAQRRVGSNRRTVLIGRNFDPARGYDAMLPLVRTEGLDVEETRAIDPGEAVRHLAAELEADPDTLRLIAGFPERLRHDIQRLFARFIALRPEVVHLWQDGSISVGAVAAVLAGVPRIVASVRNMAPRPQDRRRDRPYLRTLYRTLATRSDVTLTANSAAGATDYERTYGLPAGSITVLRNGIEIDRIRARASAQAISEVRGHCRLGETDRVIGGVFRLVPAKRPELWIETAGLLAREYPDVSFLIVGDGVMRSALEGQAARLGIGGRLIFSGPQRPVEPWIAAMSVMLLTSDVEGLPNVVLEAQALGVPVVAAQAGGTGEALRDGQTGRIVPDANAQNLAAAVGAILNDASLLRSMKQAGPIFIEERFNLQRMLDATLESYGLRD